MTLSDHLKQDIDIRQAELDRDKQKYQKLIDRSGGRDALLSSSFDHVQKSHNSEHIALQNSECDFLKQPQEPQL